MMNCPECGMNFDEIAKKAHGSKLKYCTEKCRVQAGQKRAGRNSPLKISSGNVGALAELLVSADLLKKGYEVYRALSPHCSGDLLTEKEGKFIKVEVRTGYQSFSNGKVSFPKKNVKSDIFGVVIFRTNEIRYFDGKNFSDLTL